MSLNFNGINVDKVVFNGTELSKLIFNNIVVFEKSSLYNYPSNYTFIGSDGIYYYFYDSSKSTCCTIYKDDKSWSDSCGYPNDPSNTDQSCKTICNGFMYIANDTWSLSDVNENTLKNCSILCLSDGGSCRLFPFAASNDLLDWFSYTYSNDTDMVLDDVSIHGLYSDDKNNKLIIKIAVDYHYDKESGGDSWTETYRDYVYVIGEAFLDEFTFDHVKQFSQVNIETDKPSSYYYLYGSVYYNPYTDVYYSAWSAEDNNGDTMVEASAGNYNYSSAFASKLDQYLGLARFSIKDTDITIIVGNTYVKGTFVFYAFRGTEERMVTSTITSTEHPELISASSSNSVELFYDGTDILFVNKTLRVIIPLQLNTDDMTITV